MQSYMYKKFVHQDIDRVEHKSVLKRLSFVMVLSTVQMVLMKFLQNAVNVARMN
ncbi:unnamed protein product [Trichobilharzia regenti]|nr:unnamed protein product [Trichobilharzia regenti]